jgi:membrane protein implicated in regulation of membrane protease activity
VKDESGNGLVLFPSRESKANRRRKLLLAGLVLLAALALGWPIYPWFAGIHPRILGLPLSFAWAIFWMLAVFLGLVWLYRVDEHDSEERPADQTRAERRG